LGCGPDGVIGKPATTVCGCLPSFETLLVAGYAAHMRSLRHCYICRNCGNYPQPKANLHT